MTDTAAEPDEIRSELMQALALPPDTPENVIAAALNDPLYAHHLAATRDVPAFRTQLMRHPPTIATQDGDYRRVPAGSLAKSLLSWARTGFGSVDQDLFEARLAACRSCPHSGPAPDTMTYRVASLSSDRPTICNLCGCPLSRKARMASEQCPDQDVRTGRTRWDEVGSTPAHRPDQ